MNTEQTLFKTVKKLQKDIDRYTVTTLQVQDAIRLCNLPQPLKVVLQWIAAWTLRKRGYFSFLKAYLGLLGTMLVTRPKLWAWIIAKLFENGSPVGKLLLAIVQFFDGYIDSAVFWTLTVIVILVVVFNFIVEFQKNKNEEPKDYSQMVKRRRAQGECLGTESRRRTRLTAKSHGEP